MNFWGLVQKIWEGFKQRQRQTTRSGPSHSHRQKLFVGDKKSKLDSRLPSYFLFSGRTKRERWESISMYRNMPRLTKLRYLVTWWDMVLWMNAELGLTVNDSGYTAKKEFHKFFTSEFDTQITVWMGKKIRLSSNPQMKFCTLLFNCVRATEEV